MVTTDDLSDDEEDVLRALRHMARIEASYRVPPHFQAAAQHLLKKHLVREVAWQGPAPPFGHTTVELTPTGALVAARLPDLEQVSLYTLKTVARRAVRHPVERCHDAPPS